VLLVTVGLLESRLNIPPPTLRSSWVRGGNKHNARHVRRI